MAVELVIKINADVYTRLFDNGIQDNEIAIDDICEIARALRLGTPLPKEHGRLIDAKQAEEQLRQAFDEHEGYNSLARYIVRNPSETPTIIEAESEK